ncbi:MAG: REP-associated tyrosine transposase [Terriglobales bacterium]
MAIPRRNASPQNARAALRTFFVSSCTWGRRATLQSQRSAGLLIEVLYEYRAQGRYRLHEFVVMPDHFHLLITVGADMTIERAVQLIKGGFAYRAGRELGRRPPIWQKGFSELRVLEPVAYAHQCEYIRCNPVVRGLAARPEEFPFSSAFPGFDLDAAPQGLKPREARASFGTAEAVP